MRGYLDWITQAEDIEEGQGEKNDEGMAAIEDEEGEDGEEEEDEDPRIIWLKHKK